ncbi:MAG TPA: TonB-dependent receptor [Dongiaceae bacterium]|nr:TonB-dependent receptor [Dongiaceae bacterium]
MRLTRPLSVVLLMFALCSSLSSQSSQGRILGTVSDQSGALVAGAIVTVTNTATNLTQQLVTTNAGDYVASNLEPGQYRVSAEAKGFKKTVSSQVVLEVSRDVRIDLRLQPGAVNETVEVSAEGSLVDTTDATLNGVLSNKAISDLPVQGRDFQNLLELHPGVQRTPGGGFHSVTSNGNRPDDNNFFIDGADDNDAYYGETVINDAGIQGTPASFLPLDSIQEFNTQESPTADYGVKPGVVMNIGIKSGTNDIHGSAYYFHRNSAFDARNYFNPAPQPLAALIMHEFGASLGGPIKKDKWFYFVNYEGIRDKVGNPGVVDSPVTTSLANQFGGIVDGDGNPTDAVFYSVPDAISFMQSPQGIAYCKDDNFDNISTCALNPLSQSLTSLLLPNPGFTASQSDPAAIDFDFNNINRGDNLVAKTDYVLNKNNVLSARFIYGNTNQIEEDAYPLRPEWLSTTSPITQVLGVNWASNPSSAWSNEARFSYNTFDESIYPVDHTVNATQYGLNTGVTDSRLFGFPRISPGGEFNYMGGNSSWPLNTTPIKTYSFGDTASYTRGRQTLRFGGTFRYGDVDYYRAGYGRGRVDFRHLWNFMAGDVRRWRFLYGDPHRSVSQKSMGIFLEDDFKATRRVTLNLGLRYDITGSIKDSHNLLANYVPTSTTGLVQVGQGIGQPYPTNYNNLSPRIGLAWDVFGSGKTVVRAGFGMIFEQPSIRTFMFNGGGLNLNPTGIPYIDANGIQQNPTGTITSFEQISSDGTQIQWLQPNQTPTIFPNASTSGSICSIDSQCGVFVVDPHLKTPYVMNWNLNIQQALSKSTLLQVAYVANHGVRLYSVTDINQVDQNSPLENDPNNPDFCDHCELYGRPLVTNCPTTSFGGLGSGGPCFPWLGFFSYLGNRSNSNFNSLQITLTKRYSRGLYLLAGYTYAHAIDTATSNLAGVPPDSNNYAGERGNGDYDIRHRFTLSLTYDLPSRKSKGQMLEGWQVTSIVNLQTGMPYTLYDGGNDISLTGELNDRWNMAGPAGNVHWSAKGPISYIDRHQFNTFTDSSGIDHTASGIGAEAQKCVDAAMAAGGQAAADQLIRNPAFYNVYGFHNTSGGCYVSGNAVITAPAPGLQGNMGRNIFTGPRFANWDFSLSKVWKINERVRMQFRGEVFNILNHPNFQAPGANETDLSVPTTVGTVIYTPDIGAANPVIGSGGSRHIQLGAKILW